MIYDYMIKLFFISISASGDNGVEACGGAAAFLHPDI